jgi:hypothetical protein
LFGLLLLATGFVHAEGVCPPGMFPTNPPGAQGPVGCAPIPGYNNQQQSQFGPPPPQWESRWGAIATDFSHSAAGASIDQPDGGAAEKAALAECKANGGSDCKIELQYGNGCAALAVGRAGHNAKAGLTIDLAKQAAMKVCNAEDSHCFIYYTACSLPVRVQ